MNNKSQTVYIIDDECSITDALQRFLESEGLSVKAFSSATDFLGVCDADMRGCIVLDINMPRMTGLELQHWLVNHDINIPIIFLTGSGDVPLSSKAFRTGALDFLEKPVDPEILLERIIEALQRDAEQWHVRHRKKLLNEAYTQLSPREKEVLKWVAVGYSSKEIAHAMGISSRTVELHRAHVMHKIKADSLADLISMAIELGI